MDGQMLDDYGNPLIDPNAVSYTQSDIIEARKLSPFVARPQGAEQAPWWASIAQYGIVKAIDNTFPGRAPGIAGNTSPGSFAGQNGRTYTQPGPLNAPPQNASAGRVMVAGASVSPWVLIAGAVALYLAFKK